VSAVTAARASRGENMKITGQRRPALLAGLLLLSLLVFAMSIQAAQAMNSSGSGAGSGKSTIDALQVPTLAQIQQHQGIGPYAPVTTAQAGTQGRGGVAVASLTPTQPKALTAAQRYRYVGRGFNSSLQPGSSGSSTSALIAAGSATAIVLVGFAAWALMRRRRQPEARPSAAYCAQHPEDGLCAAA
jgi:hypothetical protein